MEIFSQLSADRKNIRAERRRFILHASIISAWLLFTNPVISLAKAEKGKMIIIYFSHSGNTRTVAKEIQGCTRAAMAEILPKVPFPDNYQKLVEVAEKQATEHYFPAFSVDFPENINDFTIVFLGFPIWAYTMPMIIYSFLDKYKFPGKKIAPFCTHMGSGLADSEQQIRKLCPEATVLPGLAIRGTNTSGSAGTVREWLRKLD